MRFSSFVVDTKDLFDREKNPNLSLSPRAILNNDKIKKVFLDKNDKVIKNDR